MEKIIIIKGRNLLYTPEFLSYETSIPLNIEEAKKNLLDFKNISDENNFSFILAYGTLLGAIREHNFIKQDTDIDIITYDEEKLIDIIPILQNTGFKFIRYEEETGLYSIKRDSVYIDIYVARFFKKNFYLVNHKIRSSYITKTINYTFLSASFKIPKEYKKILIELYGKDWNIQIINKIGNFTDLDITRNNIKNFIKKIIPIKIKKQIKNFFIYNYETIHNHNK